MRYGPCNLSSLWKRVKKIEATGSVVDKKKRCSRPKPVENDVNVTMVLQLVLSAAVFEDCPSLRRLKNYLKSCI